MGRSLIICAGDFGGIEIHIKKNEEGAGGIWESCQTMVLGLMSEEESGRRMFRKSLVLQVLESSSKTNGELLS